MRGLPKSKLWKQSQITMNYTSPELSFSNEKRFKLHSIYWPQKESVSSTRMYKRRSDTDQIARKISKIIDQEEKNEQRMNKSEKASSKKITVKKFAKIGGSISLRQTSTSNVSHSNQEVIKRLSFYSQKPQSALRDMYGFRNPMPQSDPELQNNRLGSARERQLEGSSRGFRTSRRIDLNLPHNFYPGPGTYQIKRYLQNMEKEALKPILK